MKGLSQTNYLTLLSLKSMGFIFPLLIWLASALTFRKQWKQHIPYPGIPFKRTAHFCFACESPELLHDIEPPCKMFNCLEEKTAQSTETICKERDSVVPTKMLDI